ncbi:small acid-soluble spore protein H (minor) [Salibacterium salarium]|uniref:Small, acid-soluble spore protein H n=1 Tax=Salibacterium salarium TaxID=284579 RepID=A0A3R9P761_9BACI|nr:H-type small acid-soluble spore protein [Salibacterium salarium]MDQ0298485.1 small acid-soluble spore protein H (minor) [Salibacterium salarium]RSL34203.1 H-type small acid-soluble spore protein [Salibacterium salarium]
MDTKRAKDILASEHLINVTYQGDPIYIQDVDEQNNAAKVYELENPQQKHHVSVHELQEK